MIPPCSSFLVPTTSTSFNSWLWPTSRVRSGCFKPRERESSAHRIPGDRLRHHARRNRVATRTLSRRALRDQNDHAEPDADDAPEDDESADGDESPAPKAKQARARKKAVKVLPVMFARWAVCDNGMKRVAVFEYKDRAGADARLAEVRAQKPGTFFLLLVKDPCDPPAVLA